MSLPSYQAQDKSLVFLPTFENSAQDDFRHHLGVLVEAEQLVRRVLLIQRGAGRSTPSKTMVSSL